MRVLTMASQKGGSGKTSLAASLAVAAVEAGDRVAAIDTDPQRSLSAWDRRRQAEGVAVEAAEPAEVRAALDRARAAGATLAVVDTPGIFGAGAATALVRSGTLAPCMIAMRADVLDAMTAGQGVTELAPRGKAAAEARLLWAWIFERLGEGAAHG